MKTTTFFRGKQYATYVWHERGDGHRLMGNPGPLADWNLPGDFANGIDAALNGEGRYAGKAFFFKGPNFVEFDWGSRTCTAPRPLSGGPWNATAPLTTGIRAALSGRGARYAGRGYLFTNSESFTFSWEDLRFISRAPLSAWKLPHDFLKHAPTGRLRGFINGDGDYLNKAYFVCGTLYVVYDWTADTCTQTADVVSKFFPETAGLPDARRQCAPFFQAGYDAALSGSLIQRVTRVGPAAPKAGPQPGATVNTTPARTKVLYIWLDYREKFEDGTKGELPSDHKRNVDGLGAAAKRWSEANTDRTALVVESRHMSTIDIPSLLAPDVFAIFLAGSHAEWYEVPSRSTGGTTWKAQLDEYGATLAASKLPRIAVCGSHQFLATRRSGGLAHDWSAVRHMRTYRDTEDRSIAREHQDGRDYIPNPRIGEVGVFPIAFARESDPILRGLANPSFFVEWHHDEVPGEMVGSDFELILTSTNDHAALQDMNLRRAGTVPHLPVLDLKSSPTTAEGPRCAVQGLRHKDSSRVFYTFQFHPEHFGGNVGAEVQPPPTDRNPARTKEQLALLDRATQDGQRLLLNFFDLARSYWDRGGEP